MNLKDRFMDYWTTDIRHQDYTYDLSIFEMMIYGAFGAIISIVGFIGTIVTLPLWCVPYLIYKSYKLRSGSNE